MQTYKYRGETIAPCERAPGEHKGRWVVWAFHQPSGLPFADDLLTHYRTLAEARESIAYWQSFRAEESA